MINHIIYNKFINKFKIFNLKDCCCGVENILKTHSKMYNGDGLLNLYGDGDGSGGNACWFQRGDGSICDDTLCGLNKTDFYKTHKYDSLYCYNYFDLEFHNKE